MKIIVQDRNQLVLAQKTSTHRLGYGFIAVGVIGMIQVIVLRAFTDYALNIIVAVGIGNVVILLYGMFLRFAMRGDFVTFDRTMRTVSILGAGLSTKGAAVYSWGDVDNVTIEKSDKPMFPAAKTGGEGYRPVLVMRGGERIPMARWSSDGAALESCVAAAREIGNWQTPARATA
ncbi:MAG TPA: hypothetical protein VFK13_02070 [Gemmatimonadaceae bacterium]|nr:hypothetical protein [Gemmatimonadaceae bacterium]